jgi:hypothetical protein
LVPLLVIWEWFSVCQALQIQHFAMCMCI